MKKYRLLLALMLLFSLGLTACSRSSTGGSSPQEANYAAPEMPGATPIPSPSGAMNSYDGISDSQDTPSGMDVLARAQESKLILRAALSVESTEFDKAVEALDRLVQEKGGYYERNALQRGTYYDTSAARYGDFTIRVPQENFDAFLSAAGTVGHVVSSNETSEDVGEAYYDTEIRLKTQRTKHERLLSLLEKADNMENIIALESALSEVEYQIEQLSGTLRKYDSLVGYSTITLHLDEVLTITEHPRETVSFAGRISNAFSGGLNALGLRMSNLAVWAAYHFVGILFFFAACAVAGVVLIKRRRRHNAKTGHINPEDGV